MGPHTGASSSSCADNTRIHAVRFRAFAGAPTVSVFAVRGSGANETAASTKSLPAGGTRKLVRKGSSVLRAVLYGVGGGVEGRAMVSSPTREATSSPSRSGSRISARSPTRAISRF